jgi:hypothetical protein
MGPKTQQMLAEWITTHYSTTHCLEEICFQYRSLDWQKGQGWKCCSIQTVIKRKAGVVANSDRPKKITRARRG